MTTAAAVYFAYLAGMASVRRKARPALLSVAVLLSLFIVGMPHVMPLVYLLAGYWLPALLVDKPDRRVEQQLLGVDRRLFGAEGLAGFAQRAPRALIEYLELSYFLCYAVVPAGYACLALTGQSAAAIDRFWSIVLVSGYVCYGLLPWLPTRAPRAVEPHRGQTRSSFRRLNLAVLDRASVQWNTFPSGHTSASLATALAVGSHMPLAGLALGFVAAGVAAGSVVGRYHYAADALAGAAVAFLVFLMAGAAPVP